MKLLSLTTAAVFAASTALAGNANFQPDTTPPVEVVPPPEAETGSSSGSAGWIVPLVAIALIALAVSNSGDDEEDCQDVSPETAHCGN